MIRHMFIEALKAPFYFSVPILVVVGFVVLR